MADAGSIRQAAITSPLLSSVTLVRVAIVIAILAGWELLARSGWLYEDVVPPLGAITAAIVELLSKPEYYYHLGVTAAEIGTAMLIGGGLGLLVGLVLGASPFIGRAFEPYLYYFGPTPKIIFFPIMIMWFGVGPGSKIALGALSCFFPVALSVAAGMRGIDPVLIRVGKSFRAKQWQMASKIYVPAMRHPIINGIRIGLGVCVIGTLLAETKLSNQGLGYLIIQAYALFDMPKMYALLVVLFVLSIGANALIGRFGGLDSIKRF